MSKGEYPKGVSKNKTEHSKATPKDSHVNWRSNPEALNSFKKKCKHRLEETTLFCMNPQFLLYLWRTVEAKVQRSGMQLLTEC